MGCTHSGIGYVALLQRWIREKCRYAVQERIRTVHKTKLICSDIIFFLLCFFPQSERVQLDQNANVVVTGGGDGANSAIATPAVGVPSGSMLPSAPPQPPTIHSQPMVPNPQQAMGQQSPMPQQQVPSPQQQQANPFMSGQPQDPMGLSVQYRDGPGGM